MGEDGSVKREEGVCVQMKTLYPTLPPPPPKHPHILQDEVALPVAQARAHAVRVIGQVQHAVLDQFKGR